MLATMLRAEAITFRFFFSFLVYIKIFICSRTTRSEASLLSGETRLRSQSINLGDATTTTTATSTKPFSVFDSACCWERGRQRINGTMCTFSRNECIFFSTWFFLLLLFFCHRFSRQGRLHVLSNGAVMYRGAAALSTSSNATVNVFARRRANASVTIEPTVTFS